MISLNSSNLLLVSVSTIIIVIAVAITGIITNSDVEESPQILVVGPVWNTDSWLCVSDRDFIIHGTVRGIEGSLLKIGISEHGTQSLYALEERQLESFSVGASGGSQITITRTGTVTGFLTMETSSGADANCVPL